MTTIQPSILSVEEIDKRFTVSREEREAITKAKQQEAQGLLARLLLDTKGLDSIIVIGYTPGFNDGEPCVHSQDGAYLNGLGEYGEAPSAFGVDESDDAESDWSAAFKRTANIVGAMADLLGDAFGTNWAIRVKRDGDSVTFEQEEYDCGY